MTLILNRNDVMSVLTMKDCMDAVEQAFAELTNGTAVLPLRTNISPPDGVSLYMPAYLKQMKALACKVVTVYKNNPARFNLPVVIGKVLLQDPESGDVLCIMDGGYLTAVRTGAASGVATKYLARKDDEQIAGIFGTGVQARQQLLAIAEARKLSKAFIFDIADSAMDKFISDIQNKVNFPIMKAKNADDMVTADIICTATSSAVPIFNGKKIRPGTHINGIGSHSPNARELDSDIIRRSKFIGDSREACFSEAGDIIIPVKEGIIDESHFYAELGEIITGKKIGRITSGEITLFKSNGLAIQDTATAKLVYDKAKAAGIGINISI
ncbi:MAG: ornithine cyclodeaminase family protein [Bacteroidetes bacterium]|nr:ornithine cyclodeaminase family protein [Bacteroidota bacterium]